MSRIEHPRFEYIRTHDRYFPRISADLANRHYAKQEAINASRSMRVTNNGIIVSEDNNRKLTVEQITKLRDRMYQALKLGVEHFAVPVLQRGSLTLNRRDALLADPMSLATRKLPTVEASTYSPSTMDQPLTRYDVTSGVALPAGMIMLTKLILGTRSNSEYVPAVITGYNADLGRYEVDLLHRNDALPYRQTRRSQTLYLTLGMLMEFKATIEACDVLLARMASASADWTSKVNVATLRSVINVAAHMHLKGMHQNLNYEEYMVMDASSGASAPSLYRHLSQNGYDMLTGVVVGSIWCYLKPVIFEGVHIPPPPAIDPRNYDKLLRNMRLHSKRMLASNHVHRSNHTAEASIYQLSVGSKLHHCTPIKSQQALLAARNDYVITRGQYRDLGQWIAKVKHAANTRDNNTLRELIKPTEMDKYFLRCSTSLARGTRRIPEGYNNAYSILGSVLFAAGIDHNDYFICSDVHRCRITLKVDAVRIVDHLDGRGQPVYTYLSPAQVESSCVQYEGEWYLRDNMYRWSDGSMHPTNEPQAIVGYHDSKRYVGYIPTTMEPPYLGLELEVSVPDSVNKENVARQVRKAGNTDFGINKVPFYLSCERDGSIGHGFEIVTGHTGLDVHARHLKAILGAGFKISNDGNTGLHVHICKKGASLMHMARMDKLVNAENMYQLILAVARRVPNSYCTRESGKDTKRRMISTLRDRIGRPPKNRNERESWVKALRSVRHTVSFNYSPQRYAYINFQNERTMEFRMFRSSVKFHEVMAALEFTYAVWHFCKFNTDSQLNAEQFCKFISRVENRKNTVNLRNVLAESGFRVFLPNTNKKPVKPAMAQAV